MNIILLLLLFPLHTCITHKCFYIAEITNLQDTHSFLLPLRTRPEKRKKQQTFLYFSGLKPPGFRIASSILIRFVLARSFSEREQQQQQQQNQIIIKKKKSKLYGEKQKKNNSSEQKKRGYCVK